jgi:hypothetical protein
MILFAAALGKRVIFSTQLRKDPLSFLTNSRWQSFKRKPVRSIFIARRPRIIPERSFRLGAAGSVSCLAFCFRRNLIHRSRPEAAARALPDKEK